MNMLHACFQMRCVHRCKTLRHPGSALLHWVQRSRRCRGSRLFRKVCTCPSAAPCTACWATPHSSAQAWALPARRQSPPQAPGRLAGLQTAACPPAVATAAAGQGVAAQHPLSGQSLLPGAACSHSAAWQAAGCLSLPLGLALPPHAQRRLSWCLGAEVEAPQGLPQPQHPSTGKARRTPAPGVPHHLHRTVQLKTLGWVMK